MKRRDVVAGMNQQFVTATAGVAHMEWRCGDDLVTVACHEDSVPAYVEGEIAKLYGSLYSSIPLLRVYHSLGGQVNTFVMRRNGMLDAIFLARINAGVLNIINEGIVVSDQQIRLFCAYLFERYRHVSVIGFSSIDLAGGSLACGPHQRYRCRENIVISLPPSTQAYHASLGKNLRRNLKRYGERLQRDFPDYTYQVMDGALVAEEDIRAIIRLNMVRMATKNKTSAYDEKETERLVALTRQCGLVGLARIDGRICCGALSFRTGENYALSVLAHDPAYNDYSLGILCAYHIICDCIERGAREFHFLWGRYDYKFLLLAKERPLHNLTVYRSRATMLLHADVFIRNEFESGQRRCAEWLHVLGKKDTPAARVGIRLLMALRSAKRLIWR